MKRLPSQVITLLFSITSLTFSAKSIQAQDAVTVDPRHFRVEFENDRVRVLRVTYGPGESSPMHGHPAGELVLLTDYHFKFTLADGQTQERQGKAGDMIMWPSPVQYISQNLSDKPIEAILVEIKPIPVIAAEAPPPTSSLPFAFRPACATPSFPTPSPSSNLGIDFQCSVAGSGGAEAQQNAAKNNFCASGDPEVITFEDLKNLQARVNADRSINFGNKNTLERKKGPTIERAPLKALGEGKLVTLRAFVLIARQEGAESVNCGNTVPENDDLFHDIHISLVASAETPLTNECSSVVAEMSPHHRPDAWTQANLQKVAKAKALARVTGQLFFDSSHVVCAGNTAVPGNPKRMSLWEIHPIYKFEVCTADCDGAGVWVPLDEWAKQH